MVNYENSKVYKIEPIVNHEEGDIYIGSTTKEYLSQRMVKHRNGYKRWKNGLNSNVTAYNIFDKYGVENCRIILIENCICNTKDELHAREAYYIKTLACVNKHIPLQSSKEYYERNKEKIINNVKTRYLEKADEILEKKKEFRKNNPEITKEKEMKNYIKNKDKILERNKIYRDQNKEKMKEYKINYQNKNNERIREQKNEKNTCVCGSVYTYSNKVRHLKSKKHLDFENNIISV